MRHFTSAMENHRAEFIAFAEEADYLVFANLIIMLRGGGPELYFLELRTAAALALLVRLFVLLIEKFAVIGNLTNRRVRSGRNLHQIQSLFARHFYGFKRLHFKIGRASCRGRA